MGNVSGYEKLSSAGREIERAELEAVLDSAVFRRAPNQSRLLRYLCERSLECQSEPLKEHQIALEALGRSNDFDERENSIVRVEVFRVRKKLRQYYETEGRDHLLRINIEPGQYIPRFEWVSTDVPDDPDPAEGDPKASAEPSPAPSKTSKSWYMLVALVFAALTLLVAGVMIARNLVRPAAVSRPPAAKRAREHPPLEGAGDEIRILAGYPRSVQIDRLGHVWMGDRYYSGGQAAEAPRHVVARTPDQTIFRYYRVGDFYYNIPLKPQIYEMRLYFAQSIERWTVSDQPSGSFLTYIAINGKDMPFHLNFAADGIADSTADVRVFKNISPAKDGQLHLHFIATNEFSFINAIELVPGVRNRLLPIRITARDSFYTDHLGYIWPPDRFYRGGTAVERRNPVTGTEDPDLFSSERYGNFDYLISLAPGTYALTLGFAETWFGPKSPGGGGAGSRIFNIFANGAPLIRNLDVYREAGGSEKALLKTFHGIHPDADGKLRLAFTASRNFAMVNNILIEDESK